MIPLPITFVPGPLDVICGRGKDTLNHEGNKRYKTIVKSLLQKYAAAINKYDKTLIVSEAIEKVRYPSNPQVTASTCAIASEQQQPQQRQEEGQFVKKCEEDGRWYEVAEHLIREKVSQGFRDSLHKLYKSSTKSKRRRRDNASAGIVHDMRTLVCSNLTVSSCIENLNDKITSIGGRTTPDMFAATMFYQTNMDMLEAFKKDKALLVKFREAEEQQKADSR